MRKLKKIWVIALALVFTLNMTIPTYAEGEDTAYSGVPNSVTLNISNLDSSGNLIYIGIDFGVFCDKDNTGSFSCVKAQRFLTKSTNITINLDKLGFEKTKKHKCAYRVLYVPTGVMQFPIIIGDYNNGKEGWIGLDETLFIPSYFEGDISKFIKHTDTWEEHRLSYNANAPYEDRGENVFWSGERFVCALNLNVTVPAVTVGIRGTSYKIRMTNYTTSGSSFVYKGELWDESFIDRWGNYIPQSLDMVLTVEDAHGVTLEEKVTAVIIDNRHKFYQTHKVGLDSLVKV